MSTFKLPDLGEGLAEAEILEWHVRPGDQVRADQPMVSVETAKAVVEVPVPHDGIVTALCARVGEVVATGAPLIEFDSGTVVGRMPAAAEAAAEAGLDSGAEPAPSAMADGARIRALPGARQLARTLNVDLGALEGGGPDGAITLEDVLARAGVAPGGRAPAPALAVPAGAAAHDLRGARRSMARSMSASRDQVAGSTVCDDADLGAWTRLGDFTARLVRAMACAARTEPALNGWYDAAGERRILADRVDLAIAVDTPDGLIVPVLRGVQALGLDELRAAVASARDAARRRTVGPQDLRDFTLMFSNFGTLAGRYGIPLVVPPALAILGAGKVRKEAVVVGDAVVARPRMPLSLSFDHRCVTGGEACRFLAAVITDLERPD